MIDCSFIENHQRRYALGTGTQANHYFLSLLNATFFYRHQHDLLPTLDRFENCRHHQCQKISHLKRELSTCPLFKNLFEANLQIFSVWSFDHWKAMIRLLSYRNVSLDLFSLFAEHFSRKYRRFIDSFRADTLFFRCKRCFTFWILPFVLAKRGPPGGLGSLIEPDSPFIWHHRLIVLKPIPPFKSRWIFVWVSPFCYFESTIFWRSLLFIV